MRAFHFQRRDGATSIAGKAVGVLAFSVVALLIWLTADPEAHEHFHHDAGHHDHHCVVTDFATGKGFHLTPFIVVRPEETVSSSIRFDGRERVSGPVERALPPVCGPPAGATASV